MASVKMGSIKNDGDGGRVVEMEEDRMKQPVAADVQEGPAVRVIPIGARASGAGAYSNLGAGATGGGIYSIINHQGQRPVMNTNGISCDSQAQDMNIITSLQQKMLVMEEKMRALEKRLEDYNKPVQSKNQATQTGNKIKIKFNGLESQVEAPGTSQGESTKQTYLTGPGSGPASVVQSPVNEVVMQQLNEASNNDDTAEVENMKIEINPSAVQDNPLEAKVECESVSGSDTEASDGDLDEDNARVTPKAVPTPAPVDLRFFPIFHPPSRPKSTGASARTRVNRAFALKRFRCHKCSKSYTSNASLLEHMTNHTGIKLHKCLKCGKLFQFKKTLWDHERLHTGERPYRCKRCGKGFRLYQTLQSHYEAKTPC